MKNVYFHSEEELYKNFKILCELNNEKVGNKLNGLMRHYVSENSKILENPNMQDKLPQFTPEIFAKPKEWKRYIASIDNETFSRFDLRLYYFNLLMKFFLRQEKRKGIATVSNDRKLFFRTEEQNAMGDIFLELKHLGLYP